MKFHTVVHTGLDLTAILLHQPTEPWEYKHEPAHLAGTLSFIENLDDVE